MSGREQNASLVDDIFGDNTLLPVAGYSETAPVLEPAVQAPVYAPTISQPEVAEEPTLFAVVKGHEDKPIYQYRDGRKVVRVPRQTLGSVPASELPTPIAETFYPAPVAPVGSVSFNLRQNTDGISGDFDVKGNIVKLLGSLAGAAAITNSQNTPSHQIESKIMPTQPAPQRVVEVAPPIGHENEAIKENDRDPSGMAVKTIAKNGLGKLIKSVVRPKFAKAILALSAVTAGGAYYAASGEVNPVHLIPRETINVFQADFNQIVQRPIETGLAQLGRLKK